MTFGDLMDRQKAYETSEHARKIEVADKKLRDAGITADCEQGDVSHLDDGRTEICSPSPGLKQNDLAAIVAYVGPICRDFRQFRTSSQAVAADAIAHEFRSERESQSAVDDALIAASNDADGERGPLSTDVRFAIQNAADELKRAADLLQAYLEEQGQDESKIADANALSRQAHSRLRQASAEISKQYVLHGGASQDLCSFQED
jgi:hypothetical protein